MEQANKSQKEKSDFFLLFLLWDLQLCQLSQGSYDCSQRTRLNETTAKEGMHGMI